MMKKKRKCIRHVICVKIIFVILTQFFSLTLQAQTNLQGQYESLDGYYFSLLEKIYQSNISKAQHYPTITLLKKHVESLNAKKQTILAISTVRANLQTIYEDINNDHVLFFINLLIKNDDITTARKLYIYMQKNAESYFLAKAALQLAKYSFQHREWVNVLSFLEGNIDNLNESDAEHALMLYGSSLQYIKKHRTAIKFYERVPQNSKFYTHAQLNIAIAYIRQDWWTDAHLLIKQLLDNPQANLTQHFSDRLYLVLAYSLLRQEFYRDARSAFRQISLDSQYVNRALLGLGLSAAGQNDFVSALNIISKLKDKKEYELSTEESYILLPYIYSKIGQQTTAAAAYNEAMEYYKNRIEKLKQLLEKPIEPQSQQEKIFPINQENKSPIFNNLYILNLLKKQTESEKYKQNINELLNHYNKKYQSIYTTEVKQYIHYLNSYLNQARYGLAYLYDKKSNEKN